MILYRIYDSKAEVWTEPLSVGNNGSAIRWFQDQVNEGDAPWSKHPEDFALFAVGESLDDGRIVPLDAVKHVAAALELVSRGADGMVREVS